MATLKGLRIKRPLPRIRTKMWDASAVFSDDGTEWYLPNNKGFTHWITQQYSQYRLTESMLNVTCDDVMSKTQTKPFPYQLFVRDYISPKTPFRGLLAYHQYGAGKTVTGVLTAEEFRRAGLKVVFLANASLHSNFKKTLVRWGNDDIRIPKDVKGPERFEAATRSSKLIGQSYSFITMNAANTLDELNKLAGSLDDKLVIVDEVHNLVSMMTNNGKKGKAIYKMFMEAPRTKFLFLTGSPLVNRPFELALLFNILHGPIEEGGRRDTLFPEDEDDFNDLYIDTATNQVKNVSLFRRRIAGLVSYYKGAQSNLYPELINEPIEKVPMSKYQLKQYLQVRKLEKKLDDSKRRGMQEAAMIQKGKVPSSSFRSGSRQVSNWAMPPGVTRPKKRDILITVLSRDGLPEASEGLPDYITESIPAGSLEDFQVAYDTAATTADKLEVVRSYMRGDGDSVEEANEDQFSKRKTAKDKAIDAEYARQLEQLVETLDGYLQMDDEHNIYLQQNLGEYSPKMQRMMEVLTEGPGHEGPALVYSAFRQLEGIGLFSNVLRANGFEQLEAMGVSSLDDLEPGVQRYCIISGSETLEERAKVLEIFNHPRNTHGELIKVLLGTSAAAEGLDLFNIRQILLMEPHWNEIRMQQVIARGRRICSHYRLPADEQNVHVFRFMSIIPQEEKTNVPGHELVTTDEYIYDIAQKKEVLNNQFLQLLKEAALDCYLNHVHNTADGERIDCMAMSTESGVSYSGRIAATEHDTYYQKLYAQKTVQTIPYKSRLHEGQLLIIKGEKVRVKLGPGAKPKEHMAPGQAFDAIPAYDERFFETSRLPVLYIVMVPQPEGPPKKFEYSAKNVQAQ